MRRLLLVVAACAAGRRRREHRRDEPVGERGGDRGAKVHGIPAPAIPAVLAKLAHAAERVGKLPAKSGGATSAYAQLAPVLRQLAPKDG